MILRERVFDRADEREGSVGWLELFGRVLAVGAIAEVLRANWAHTPLRVTVWLVGWPLALAMFFAILTLAFRWAGARDTSTRLRGLVAEGWFSGVFLVGMACGWIAGFPVEIPWVTPAAWPFTLMTAGLYPVSAFGCGIAAVVGYVLVRLGAAMELGARLRLSLATIFGVGAASLVPSFIGWMGSLRDGAWMPTEMVSLQRGFARLLLDSTWWREAHERFFVLPGLETEESVWRLLLALGLCCVGGVGILWQRRRVESRWSWSEVGWFVAATWLGVAFAMAAPSPLAWKPVDGVAMALLACVGYAVWTGYRPGERVSSLWTVFALGGGWILGWPLFFLVASAVLVRRPSIAVALGVASWWALLLTTTRFAGAPVFFCVALVGALECAWTLPKHLQTSWDRVIPYAPSLAMLILPLSLGSFRALLATSPFAFAYAFFHSQGTLSDRLKGRLTLGYAILLGILVAGHTFVS